MAVHCHGVNLAKKLSMRVKGAAVPLLPHLPGLDKRAMAADM
jgi:hypothetical protein